MFRKFNHAAPNENNLNLNYMKRFTLILFCLAFFAVTGYAQDLDSLADGGGTVANAFDWTDFITGIVSLALGAWVGRTKFADKGGEQVDKYKGKLDDVAGIIDDVLADLRNNTFTKEGVKAYLERGKQIIKKE